MPDEVIVTVTAGSQKLDYSLPARIPIKDWIEILAEDLGAGETGVLRCQEEILDSSRSLASYGVWDGAVLIFEKE